MLVLIRNNPIENSVSIEHKTADRYMGPYRVVRRTQGGSYVLEEMNGNLLRHTTAAFRLILYIQRKELAKIDYDPESDDSENNFTESQPNLESDDKSDRSANSNPADQELTDSDDI